MMKSASFWGGVAVSILVVIIFGLLTPRAHSGGDHGADHGTEHHEAAEHAEGHDDHGGGH
jgi:hypothetical protein